MNPMKKICNNVFKKYLNVMFDRILIIFISGILVLNCLVFLFHQFFEHYICVWCRQNNMFFFLFYAHAENKIIFIIILTFCLLFVQSTDEQKQVFLHLKELKKKKVVVANKIEWTIFFFVNEKENKKTEQSWSYIHYCINRMKKKKKKKSA
ncbi:hypothetical protein RFI_19418 [Reticulomyxa filosa]|uniref:Uncharacterized protein n=1 Tax=Reticulomyxa filosa TaxID=46433 RepID=X6MWA1_RETFI|nr:hypothetical protein RFI_19418 [Reticulomyxa filosa]|eukprot:ETO17891.1 hypothetical protein RFI_19418 [Reticulomyxa filosa]